MPIWQVLAIVVALVEIVGGLLITFNVLTRGAAVVLLLFTAVTTFYYHDFCRSHKQPDPCPEESVDHRRLAHAGGVAAPRRRRRSIGGTDGSLVMRRREPRGVALRVLVSET